MQTFVTFADLRANNDKTKAKLSIVFINRATAFDMIYITVVNINPKRKSGVE